MRLPRPQLHLSTCIVLMFVAGGLVWANFQARENAPTLRHPLGHASFLPYPEYGWPTTCCNDPLAFEDPRAQVFVSRPNWSPWNLAINLATALAILAAVAFACEWLIRRRAQQRAKS